MTWYIPALALAMLLAACGADAPPERPGGQAESGITLSGDARFGVQAKW
ncbi:MAG: argininosuccinate lyase [Gemmobacter sp.]